MTETMGLCLNGPLWFIPLSTNPTHYHHRVLDATVKQEPVESLLAVCVQDPGLDRDVVLMSVEVLGLTILPSQLYCNERNRQGKEPRGTPLP